MSLAGFNFCLSCGDKVYLTVHHVTEHLERRHNLLASASVLAANMFANNQAYEEVCIILKEFDEKNAAIEHMEKNKIATLQVLSQKDCKIKALIEDVNELKKQFVCAAGETARLRSEIMTHEEEDHKKEMVELRTQNVSLAKEVGNLRQHANSMSSELKGLEKRLNEKEAENAQLKDCVEAQQNQLRSVAETIENVKTRIVVQRNDLKMRIGCLTTELLETKDNLQKIKRQNEVSKTSCENIQNLCKSLEELNEDKCVEISKLKKSLEGKDAMYQEKWEVLKMEKKKVMENLSQSFDENKKCLEDTLKEHQKKLETALEKKNFKYQERWEGLTMEKNKVIENLRQSFDVDKKCLENALKEKEIEIGDLTNEFRSALNQAKLLELDLKKHQMNIMEHLQAISKAMQVMRNVNETDYGDVGNVMKFCGEAFDSLVKSLVAKDKNCIGEMVLEVSSQAEGLHNYLCEKIPLCETGADFPASAAREQNNNDRQAKIL